MSGLIDAKISPAARRSWSHAAEEGHSTPPQSHDPYQCRYFQAMPYIPSQCYPHPFPEYCRYTVHIKAIRTRRDALYVSEKNCSYREVKLSPSNPFSVFGPPQVIGDISCTMLHHRPTRHSSAGGALGRDTWD